MLELSALGGGESVFQDEGGDAVQVEAFCHLVTLMPTSQPMVAAARADNQSHTIRLLWTVDSEVGVVDVAHRSGAAFMAFLRNRWIQT